MASFRMLSQSVVCLCLVACAGGVAGQMGEVDAGTASALPPAGVAPIPVLDAGTVDAGSPSLVDAGVVPDAGVVLLPVTDVPTSLIQSLSGTSYVEGSCVATTYPKWPYPAQDCTYHGSSHVIIANPPATRVATWIVEASRLIPALDSLHQRDRAHWEAALKVIALQTLYQSSRIYPLSGEIWENGVDYGFTKGVTDGCTTGCYCRINSLTRAQWCSYQAALGLAQMDACLAAYGVKTLQPAWLEHCFANHIAAWSSDVNEHYRAQAYLANLSISKQFSHPESADGEAVLKAVQAQYPP